MSEKVTERIRPPTTFRSLWCSEQYTRLRKMLTQEIISDMDLKMFILKKYSEKYETQGRLYNNIDNSNMIMSTESFINHWLNDSNILSGYAVMYNTHEGSINLGAMALDNLLKQRKIYKKKMNQAEYGSAEYIYYKILQLTYKVLANSYYGVQGEKNSVFYNSFVQNAITTTAQDLITTSIIAMELFLGDNFEFEKLDDVFNYCENILKERPLYNILDYTEPITEGVLASRLLKHFTPKLTSSYNKDAFVAYVSQLSEIERTRIYYKCNINELINLRYFRNSLNRLKAFEYGEEIPEEMEEPLADFRDKLLEFGFYDHLLWNRFKKAMTGKRDVVVAIDTDFEKSGSIILEINNANFVNCGKLLRV